MVFNHSVFEKSIIKLYLDFVYGIPDCLEGLDLPTLLELLRFAAYDGKSQISGLEDKLLLYTSKEITHRIKPSAETRLFISKINENVHEHYTWFKEALEKDITQKERIITYLYLILSLKLEHNFVV